jgi:hypothetical protein
VSVVYRCLVSVCRVLVIIGVWCLCASAFGVGACQMCMVCLYSVSSGINWCGSISRARISKLSNAKAKERTKEGLREERLGQQSKTWKTPNENWSTEEVALFDCLEAPCGTQLDCRLLTRQVEARVEADRNVDLCENDEEKSVCRGF